MQSGSHVSATGRASSDRDTSIEAIGKQRPPFGSTARSVLRLSYWLVILVLSMASASRANAAGDDWRKTEVRNPMTLDLAKVPKAYPSDFPVIGSVASEDFLGQPPILNSEAEPAALQPITAPLGVQNLEADAVDLMVETSGVSIPVQSTSPTLPTEATGSAIEFGFPGSTQGNEAITATLFFGEDAATDTSAVTALRQVDLMAQATRSADEMPWQFSFEPFFYLPFGANGDVTVRDINAPIKAGIGDIFDAIVNDLNFAAFGRVEAWNGPWGIFFSGAYTNLGTGRTADIPVPPVLQQVGLPPQASVSAAAGTSFVQLDLGGAYRFGDGNLPAALRTADTEFDLGPFIFDALAGVRLYNFSNNLVLTGPQGNQFEFDQSNTIVEPMIGGRARWNLSPNMAALASANISGFGIGNLTFSASGFAGIDWLFSGNTSLLASYGFTYLNYSSGSSGLDLFTHGPRLGVKFRF
jgi:hypothetical protein